MFEILGTLMSGLLGIGDKLITNEGKKEEYAFKALELSNDLALKLLDTKTYPLLDGIVKLAYASNVLVTGLFRPLGSLACMGFVFYAKTHGITIDPTLQAVLVALFPAWGVSRHIEKGKRS